MMQQQPDDPRPPFVCPPPDITALCDAAWSNGLRHGIYGTIAVLAFAAGLLSLFFMEW